MPETTLSARYPTDLRSWQALKAHYRDSLRQRTLHELFSRDRKRADRFSLQAGDLYLDYSKNLLTAETRRLLLRLAREAQVPAAIKSMFAGDRVNTTEDRPALHVALRSKMSDQVALTVPGVRDVWQVLTQMDGFVRDIQDGTVRGSSGERLTEIVNIGIGGSDLGAVMASSALRHYWRPGMNFHSVSNVDCTQLVDLTEQLDPARTLFVICSKTFTTLETMSNAQAARRWIESQLGEAAVVRHFVAASTNHEAMDVFGIHPEYRFGFWDWVGGRYSLCSSVGLSLALVIGMERFESMLAGARRMDLHFQQAKPGENMPLLMALISVWYNNFFGAESHAVLPYDNRLDRFPAYLQQLQMESNGKRRRHDGKAVRVRTGQIIWGEAGSNAQHSFYQLLHQGTRLVPVDFILPVQSSGASQAQQDLAIANCLAQSEAFMDGYGTDQAEADLVKSGMPARRAALLARHKTHPGNRPSNTLIMASLTPNSLGQLLALYEHKVFVESVIWGINPFDQWGVELGKRLAGKLAAPVSGHGAYAGDNPSTRKLLDTVRGLRRDA